MMILLEGVTKSWYEHADLMSIIIGTLLLGFMSFIGSMIVYAVKKVADSMINTLENHTKLFITNQAEHTEMKLSNATLKAEHDAIKGHCGNWGKKDDQ